MSLRQLHEQVFSRSSLQAASKRITELCQEGFVERRCVLGRNNRIESAFLNTQKGIRAIANCYRFPITSDLCKSDSIEHDLALFNVRKRLQKLEMVSDYFTENMLQACAKLSEKEEIKPFSNHNTDSVIELKRQDRKLFVGLEFENSEKAQERYVKKLLSYYSDAGTPVILWICADTRIQVAVSMAERFVIGAKKPRCFYSLATDVLASSQECTFTDLKGAKIMLR